MTVETAKKRIIESGLKFTHQRMVVYNALQVSADHPTAESVYEKVKEANPSISLGTIYKTLENFVRAGILKKFTDDVGVMRFDPMLETHSHLYFTDTQEIKDYKDPGLVLLLKKYFEENQIDNFEVEELSLVIKGKTK
ncbi:Fur family transcriptional regulator [Pleomorphovibrio marinus]|uniref:Fur family transcriptional regulator n=1 Tax=Pleomorphovibrio marinus TaxID=2164132 RepID=UPI000E0ADE7A|nr:transcriptional repressor [Pleomorphovibrio marinus]